MIVIEYFFCCLRSLQIKFKPKLEPKNAVFAAKTIKKWVFLRKIKFLKKYLKIHLHISSVFSKFIGEIIIQYLLT